MAPFAFSLHGKLKKKQKKDLCYPSFATFSRNPESPSQVTFNKPRDSGTKKRKTK